MSKARSMGRKITLGKKKGKRVWIDTGLHAMLSAMAKAGRVSIGAVLDQVIGKGLTKLSEERKEQDKSQLIKVVPGLGSVREEIIKHDTNKG